MFSDMEELYSHSNGNLLKDHLFYTANGVYDELRDNKDLGFFLGLFHDFGKITEYYQNFIKSKIKNEAFLGNSDLKSHTLISAWFISFFFDNYLDDNRKSMIPGLLNCAFHHSPLENTGNILSKLFKIQNSDDINKQKESLKKNLQVLEGIFKKDIVSMIKEGDNSELCKFIEILEKLDFNAFLDNYQFIDFYRKYETYFKNIGDNSNSEYSFQTLEIYSLLTKFDKICAGKLPDSYNIYCDNKKEVDDIKIPADIIESYVNEKFCRTDEFRTKIFDEINNHVNKKNEITEYNFIVNAPTGSGKTEATLNFAIKLLDNLNLKKVIYALPLTNIIEQNYTRIENILSSKIKNFEDNKYSYLIKNHYLAEYDDLDGEDYQPDSDRKLLDVLDKADNFQSKVVVTTYVQVLYSVCSNSQSFLKRFSSFRDSILILDEPQVLNPGHWLLIRNLIHMLNVRLNCRVVLMTATKPMILKESNYLDLLKYDDIKQYIKQRTKIVRKNEINNYSDLQNMIIEKIKFHNSVLIIMNTVKSSKYIYKILSDYKKENKKEFENFQIYYLSTNLIPLHRKEKICEIEKILKNNNKSMKQKIILVSTQVIEAGVDLDFDCGIRDMAPLDSIIQCAGRVNREGRKEELSELNVIKMMDEDNNNKFFSEYIYDKSFLRFTEEILEEKTEIYESEFFDCLERYFNSISDYISDYNSENNIENVNYYFTHSMFNKLTKEFKYIDDSIQKTPVLIPYDDEVFVVIDEYQKLIKKYMEADYEEKWNISKLLSYKKRELLPYIVNVYDKNYRELKAYFSVKNKLSWCEVIEKSALEDCYSEEIGIDLDNKKFMIIDL